MPKFSRREHLTRDLMLMLNMFHRTRQICLFLQSTPLISDGKLMFVSSKNTMQNTEIIVTQSILLKHQLIQITNPKRQLSRQIKLLLELGKKQRNTNHMLQLMLSQILNYRRTLTGETSKELISLTHIEIKDIVDLAILCLLLRSLR